MKYNLLHKIWLICQCPIVFFCQWEGKILLKLEKRNKPLSANFKVIRYEKITSSDSYADVSWQGKKEKRNLEVVVCEVYESQLDFIPQPNYFPEKYTEEQKKQMEKEFLNERLNELFWSHTGNLSQMHKKEINEQNMLLLHTQKHFAINVERGGAKARESYLNKKLQEEHDKFIAYFFRHLYANQHHEHNSKPDN